MQHNQDASSLANANQADQPIQDARRRVTKVSAKAFRAKYKSKKEIYNFLACDVGVYLPHSDNVTIYFLKELMSGKKKRLSTERIRTIMIPQ